MPFAIGTHCCHCCFCPCYYCVVHVIKISIVIHSFMVMHFWLRFGANLTANFLSSRIHLLVLLAFLLFQLFISGHACTHTHTQNERPLCYGFRLWLSWQNNTKQNQWREEKKLGVNKHIHSLLPLYTLHGGQVKSEFALDSKIQTNAMASQWQTEQRLIEKE